MNVEEGNRLIARFMGGRYERIEQLTYEPKGRWVDIEEANFLSVTHPQDYNLRYHLSWDWLMPIIEKIEQLSLYKSAVVTSIHNRVVSLVYGYDYQIQFRYRNFYRDKNITKLQAVWEGCVEFINWYNQQQNEKA